MRGTRKKAHLNIHLIEGLTGLRSRYFSSSVSGVKKTTTLYRLIFKSSPDFPSARSRLRGNMGGCL